jgi:hypothetical protein
VKLGKVIGQGLQSRRHMMKRTLERAVIRRCYWLNDDLKERPTMFFTPAHISLAFDAAYASFVADGRAAGEVSRRTFLSVIEADQEDEAMWLRREREEYDEAFRTDWTPNNNGPMDPGQQQLVTRTQGRRTGGNRGGGGADNGQTNQGGRQDPGQVGRRGRAQRTERQDGGG